MTEDKNYGTEKLARLRKVFLHEPRESLKLVNKLNYKEYLFNFSPDIDQYRREHEQYADLLRTQGVEVLELQDFVRENKTLVSALPNLPYLNDTCLITSHGAIVSKMCPGSRAGEEIVVQEAVETLGIPIFHSFAGQAEAQFEGCLVISPETLLIADTERHSPATIEEFLPKGLEIFPEIIYAEIPQERRYMHPDMVFGRISESLGLYYPPAYIRTYLITPEKRSEIDIADYLAGKDMELIAVSDREQQNWGCSLVSLEPNVFIHYDLALSLKTQNILSRHGTEIIEFHPEALLAGGGSLHCLTMRLWRA